MRTLLSFMRPAFSALYFCLASLYCICQPVVSYQLVTNGLSAPVDIAYPPDGSGRLFVVQQGGTIKIWTGTALLSAPFLDVSGLLPPVGSRGGEQGLLSMAFHPNYATNGYFFIYYTDASGAVTVARYQVSADPNVADASSGVVLLTISKSFQNHNGGHLAFGSDGKLYFATGDGGSANDPSNNAQTGTVLLGKMIRIDVDNFATAPYYTVPADNPYVGNASFDGRVYNYGLRNPYRWSFDRATGDLWIGDVGQAAVEEIDYRPAASRGGNNFGWRCFEGTLQTPGVSPACDPPDKVPPVFEYGHVSGSYAVIGGYVYRGTEYPGLVGYYLATEFYDGRLYLIKPNGSGGWTVTQQNGLQTFISAFGEDANAALYAVSQQTNSLYKVTATGGVLPVVLASFSVRHFSDHNELRWTTSAESGLKDFRVEYSTDGRNFGTAGVVPPAAGGRYVYNHPGFVAGTLYYRLAMEDVDGTRRYSNVLRVEGAGGALVKVYPSVTAGRQFTLAVGQKADQLRVYNVSGGLAYRQALTGFPGTAVINLPELARGVYVVEVEGPGVLVSEKLVLQ